MQPYNAILFHSIAIAIAATVPISFRANTASLAMRIANANTATCTINFL